MDGKLEQRGEGGTNARDEPKEVRWTARKDTRVQQLVVEANVCP